MAARTFTDFALIKAAAYDFDMRGHDLFAYDCAPEFFLGFPEVADKQLTVTDTTGLRSGIAIDVESCSYVAWRDRRAVVSLHNDPAAFHEAVRGALKAVLEQAEAV